MRIALLLAVPALAACPKKKDDASAKNDTVVERPAPVPHPTTSVPIHELLAYAKGKAPGQTPVQVTIDYVRPDGMIDPAYGVVEVAFGSASADRAPADDPNRPTGAPVTTPAKPPPPTTCSRLIWRAGTWSSARLSCGTKVFEVRCTVPIIWERAIAKGAPRDAVAKLSISMFARSAPQWTFRIEDSVRGVSFRDTFDDDCGLVAEAPDPAVGPDTVADALDRKMIQNAIGTVKATVRACADKAPAAKGVVKLAVTVTAEGTATAVVKAQPSEPLGACVKQAVESARFPPTRNGGSFTYPFVF
ncbi:MAG: hypothetical protein ACKV2T_42625 [Kofleriaceae bacterium]